MPHADRQLFFKNSEDEWGEPLFRRVFVRGQLCVVCGKIPVAGEMIDEINRQLGYIK